MYNSLYVSKMTPRGTSRTLGFMEGCTAGSIIGNGAGAGMIPAEVFAGTNSFAARLNVSVYLRLASFCLYVSSFLAAGSLCTPRRWKASPGGRTASIVSDEESTVAGFCGESNGAEVSVAATSCEGVVDLSMSLFFLDRPSSGEDLRSIIEGVVGSSEVCDGAIGW